MNSLHPMAVCDTPEFHSIPLTAGNKQLWTQIVQAESLARTGNLGAVIDLIVQIQPRLFTTRSLVNTHHILLLAAKNTQGKHEKQANEAQQKFYTARALLTPALYAQLITIYLHYGWHSTAFSLMRIMKTIDPEMPQTLLYTLFVKKILTDNAATFYQSSGLSTIDRRLQELYQRELGAHRSTLVTILFNICEIERKLQQTGQNLDNTFLIKLQDALNEPFNRSESVFKVIQECHTSKKTEDRESIHHAPNFFKAILFLMYQHRLLAPCQHPQPQMTTPKRLGSKKACARV